MKATGEVMGIGSTLEECLLKSVRSLEIGAQHLWLPKFQNMTKAELTEYLHQFRDDGSLPSRSCCVWARAWTRSLR